MYFYKLGLFLRILQRWYFRNHGYYLRPLTAIVRLYCQPNSKYIKYDEGENFLPRYDLCIYEYNIRLHHSKNHVFVLVITFFQMFEDERVKKLMTLHRFLLIKFVYVPIERETNQILNLVRWITRQNQFNTI
jgi:hypothetical protein